MSGLMREKLLCRRYKYIGFLKSFNVSSPDASDSGLTFFTAIFTVKYEFINLTYFHLGVGQSAIHT